MPIPQEQGREFEKDLANEFGLKQVPGSGSVWHSKLDLHGNNARWSLKYTEKENFGLTLRDIIEAIIECFGPGGDGATPIWATRNPHGDFIIMRKEDFIAFHTDDLKLINKGNPKAEARKAQARLPELLREDDN